MKRIKSLIALFPVAVIGGLLAYRALCSIHEATLSAGKEYLEVSICIGLLSWLFTWITVYRPEPESWSRKKRFEDPIPPKQMMSTKPQGIVLGKYKGRYICDKGRPAHILCLGQSGSGKSVLLLTTLLINASQEMGSRYCLFVLDLKGELSYKSIRYDDPAAAIISISDRGQMGYDVFYKFHREDPPSSQELLSTINQIILYLVPKPANIKEPYFTDAARNLGSGLTLFYAKECLQQGRRPELIDILDRILGEPIEQQIQHVLDTSKPSTPEYRYLIMFSGMIQDKGNTTLGSVYSSLCNGLTVFSNDQDLRFMLKTNPRRVSPDTLYQEHRSVYLTLDESKLEQYSPITRLVLAQMLDAAMEKPDASKDNGNNTLFVLDEISRVLSGSTDMAKLLTSSIKTLRSKGVILYIINQTISAFEESIGSKSGVDDLVSNCEHTIVLSAKDKSTAQWIEGISGKFLQRQISQSGSYRNRKDTVSYQQQSLHTADELLRLQSEKKELLISPYGVYRLDRAAYYEDPGLSKMSQEIQQHNQEILDLTK